MLEMIEAIPATSVAVGAVHVMTDPGTPSSTDCTMLVGQLETTGGVVSTADQDIIFINSIRIL